MIFFPKGTFKFSTHIKIALPLYLYNIRIPNLGDFDIGVSIFTLILPALLAFYIKGSAKVKLFAFIPVLYILVITLLFDNAPSWIKIINFIFSYLFLYYYVRFVIRVPAAINHFLFSSTLMVFLSIIAYSLDFILDLDAVYSIDDTGAFLNIPRLNGFFMEPSHIGLVTAILLFSIVKQEKFLVSMRQSRRKFMKIIIFTALLVQQSIFGFLFLLFLNFRNKKIAYLAPMGMFLVILTTFSFPDLLRNSGTVRIYGLIYLFTHPNLSLIFGNGIGKGTEFFSSIASYHYNLELFSGFIGDFLYDIGAFGVIISIFFLVKKMENKLFTIATFLLLYLNFGLAVPLFPYLLSFAVLAKISVDQNKPSFYF